jgi:nitrite reductase [NAD(P)H] large subunit
MKKVCVVGAGRAGMEAAEEASERGADVVVLDAHDAAPLPRRAWPALLVSPSPRLGPPESFAPLSRRVSWGTRALSVADGPRVATPRWAARFDSVIIATGSKPVFPHFPGQRKRGVHLLTGPSAYLDLARAACDAGNAVVSGGGLTGLRVAEALIKEGRVVTCLYPGSTFDSRLCPEINDALSRAAGEAGVRVVPASLEGAAGSNSVEAVVASGRVLPCDALAVIPEWAPAPVVSGVRLGPRGGVLVDSHMAASSPGFFAAGSCADLAEMPADRWPPLGSPSEASGRVAGASASGNPATFAPVGSLCSTIFGIFVAAAGAPAGTVGTPAGLRIATVVREGDTVCAITHQRGGGRVLGVQVAGPRAKELSAALPIVVSLSASLESLAYADLGLTDISLLTEAARQALA